MSIVKSESCDSLPSSPSSPYASSGTGSPISSAPSSPLSMTSTSDHHHYNLPFSGSHKDALGDITNGRSNTAHNLVSLICKGDVDEFNSYMESNPKTDLNTFVNGNTALHYALKFGRDISLVKQLVSNGANPNLSNLDGWHPIHLAAHGGKTDILSYLVKCNNSRTVL